METTSMLVAGVVLFASIYGLTGMLLRRPQSTSQEAGARIPGPEVSTAVAGRSEDPPTPATGR